MDIISWIPALGITRLTLVLSPLITIRTDNKGHYAYWVYVADTSYGSSDKDEAETLVGSLVYALFLIGHRCHQYPCLGQ